jgi:hypothetical protein
MSKEDSYRILKLKSGEEIITSIKGQSSDKFVLERPMIFKTTIVPDIFGRQKEITVLKNWLSFTNEIQTKIPQDYVASFLKPAQEAIQLYELEKEKQDTLDIQPRITGYPLSPTDKRESGNEEFENFENMSDEEMKIMDLFNKLEESSKAKKKKRKIKKTIEDPDPPEEEITYPDISKFVSMTLFFPPEILLTFVDNGIIDKSDIIDLIDYLKNKNSPYTGDDVEHPDWGNRWTDWSSDLGDYQEDI